MRAYSWVWVGFVAAACGGSAFSGANPNTDDGDGGEPASGRGGALNSGGRDTVGGKPGVAGTTGKGGVSNGGAGVAGSAAVGGDVSVGGEPAVGGEPGVGGEPAAGGAGPDPVDEVCPQAQPAAHGACKSGLSCTYGDDVRASCRQHAKCDGGQWVITDPGCKELPVCEPIILGKECAADAPDCLMQGEIFCSCSACNGSLCSNTHKWACAAGPGGACPKLPPNLGQSCAGSTECTYGACAVNEGVTTTCNGATWGWDSLICPK